MSTVIIDVFPPFMILVFQCPKPTLLSITKHSVLKLSSHRSINFSFCGCLSLNHCCYKLSPALCALPSYQKKKKRSNPQSSLFTKAHQLHVSYLSSDNMQLLPHMWLEIKSLHFYGFGENLQCPLSGIRRFFSPKGSIWKLFRQGLIMYLFM